MARETCSDCPQTLSPDGRALHYLGRRPAVPSDLVDDCAEACVGIKAGERGGHALRRLYEVLIASQTEFRQKMYKFNESPW